MYKVTLHEGPRYIVAHYAANDPEPTPTERQWNNRPDAWHDAFGRAAKACLIVGAPQIVMVDDGRQFEVSVRKVADHG